MLADPPYTVPGLTAIRATYVLWASADSGVPSSRLTPTGAPMRIGPELRVASLLQAARLDAQRGDGRTCEERTTRALRTALPAQGRVIEADVASILGLLELGAGHMEAAAAHLGRCAELHAQADTPDVLYVPFAADLVEALLALGQTDAALAVAVGEDARAHANASRHPGVAAHAARCRALVAGSDAFVAEFESALLLHDAESGGAFDRARIELSLGERLRRERQSTAARERLRAAAEALEHLSARPWAARARRELDASIPAGRRRRDPTEADDLTTRELDVARILAEGATVAQAAAQLFLARKTVEAHVTSIYRKLDVHNRAQLVNALVEHRRRRDGGAYDGH